MRNHAFYKEAGIEIKSLGRLFMLSYRINDLRLRSSDPCR